MAPSEPDMALTAEFAYTAIEQAAKEMARGEMLGVEEQKYLQMAQVFASTFERDGSKKRPVSLSDLREMKVSGVHHGAQLVYVAKKLVVRMSDDQAADRFLAFEIPADVVATIDGSRYVSYLKIQAAHTVDETATNPKKVVESTLVVMTAHPDLWSGWYPVTGNPPLLVT
jgi:hypothetical protein